MGNSCNGVLVYGIDVSDIEPPSGVMEALREDDAGAELVGYGADGEGTILAVKNTMQTGEMHYTSNVDLDIPKSDIEEFMAFCAKFKIPDAQPRWLLTASYS